MNTGPTMTRAEEAMENACRRKSYNNVTPLLAGRRQVVA